MSRKTRRQSETQQTILAIREKFLTNPKDPALKYDGWDGYQDPSSNNEAFLTDGTRPLEEYKYQRSRF